MKGLVAFYSRTGTTKQAANYLAGRLGYDMAEIIDLKDRSGPKGYMTGGHDAFCKRFTEIQEPAKDPLDYDIVIIGTPVWGLNITPAVRTYLEKNKANFPEVAFFCVEGGTGGKRAFKNMQALCAKPPQGVCELTKREVKTGAHQQKLDKFIEAINLA